jgi:type VI secretion system protein ImpK
MSNKTILISNNQSNNSLTNFENKQAIPYNDFKKQKSVFKRNRTKRDNDYEISFNPFISAASPLFKLTLQLEDESTTKDVNEVREEFVGKVNLYNESASKYGIDESETLVTRYILCTFIDELVTTTSFGRNNNWSSNSLLNIFHNETYGGENFFHLLDKFLKTPAKYIHILELMYTCLSLGFEGKYRVIDRGQIELNNIKDSLYRQIKIVQGREPLTFYTKQEPSKEKYRLFNRVSYWVLFSSILLLLVIIYTSLTFSLDKQDTQFLDTLNKEYKEFRISDLKGAKK